MKKATILTLLLCLILTSFVFGQRRTKYFVLDTLAEKQMSINHIKCTEGSYKAELFNILNRKHLQLLTLFTALPDYDTKKPEWKIIKLDSVKQAILNLDSLTKKYSDAIEQFFDSNGNSGGYKLKNDYTKPIIKMGDNYYTPTSPTLLEYFYLSEPDRSYEYLYNVFPNLNQFFEINITAPLFPLKKFESIYIKKFKHPSFNSRSVHISDRFNTHYVYNKPILIRDHDTKIAGKKGYKFWTLASWTIDGTNMERGIDRFIYVPEYGIVSGAYSYYFWYEYFGRKARHLSKERNEQLLKNYLEDKQLLPYEINGKIISNPKK